MLQCAKQCSVMQCSASLVEHGTVAFNRFVCCAGLMQYVNSQLLATRDLKMIDICHIRHAHWNTHHSARDFCMMLKCNASKIS